MADGVRKVDYPEIFGCSRHKGGTGGKMGGGNKKMKTFLVASNVVTSRPPEHGPTGMPTTRAN